MRELEPGPDQPYPPGDAATIGDLFGVDVEAVARWLDQGLPTEADGRVDPMVCCNWLSWGRLDRCPALARRWRAYLACFEPHRSGRDERLLHRWDRRHALYLPGPVTGLRWWLPGPRGRGTQAVAADHGLDGDGLTTAVRSAGGWLLAADAADGVVEVSGAAEVEVSTWRVDPPAAESEALLALVAEVVGGFRYEYRRHAHADRSAPAGGGTCLDCAVATASALEAAGWRCTLEGGIVARSDIANAHYWVVVTLDDGRAAPIDPSIPAIARMLGEDWHAWLGAYLGAIDARRICLGSADEDWPSNAARFVHPVPGEAWCDQGGLWGCQDWVCGRTLAGFSVKPA